MNRTFCILVSLLVAFELSRLSPANAQSVPALINYQGQLTKADGNPVDDADRDLTFHIFDSALGGSLVWGPQRIRTPVVKGFFNVQLQNDTTGRPISAAFGSTPRWIETTVDNGAALSHRQQILSAPFALVAGNSEKLGGRAATEFIAKTGENVGIGTDPGTYRLNVQKDEGVSAGDHLTTRINDLTFGYQADGTRPTAGLIATGDGLPLTLGGDVKIAGTLDVKGSLNAPLAYLSVADAFTATVRAADFELGYSGRRGKPGRALVDLQTTLQVNYGDDWGETRIGGAVVRAALFQPDSDRALKTDFRLLDKTNVLAQVAAMEICSWTFNSDQKTRHIGPVAQDFHAAFRLGSDDKSISTTDISGVALAAIQGLNRLVEDQREMMKQKEARILSLEDRLAAIETLLKSNKAKAGGPASE